MRKTKQSTRRRAPKTNVKKLSKNENELTDKQMQSLKGGSYPRSTGTGMGLGPGYGQYWSGADTLPDPKK